MIATAMKVLDSGRPQIAAACCGSAKRLIEMGASPTPPAESTL